MSVFIKGINMSEITELVLTKNVQLILCWTSDMKITAKIRTESNNGNVTYSKEFDIVEVSEPHGRLIDADDVKSRMIPLSSFSVQDWISEVELSNCRTIIEAEGK